MSITDELRKAFDSCTVMAGVKPDFECVYITKSCALLYLDELEDALNDGYMELPKDANGEFIHIGDVMEWPDDKAFEVVGIGDGVLFYTENNESADWTGASTKRHYNPAVRDVLFEFAKRWDDEEELTDINHLDPSFVQMIDEFAAKLQLRED